MNITLHPPTNNQPSLSDSLNAIISNKCGFLFISKSVYVYNTTLYICTSGKAASQYVQNDSCVCANNIRRVINRQWHIIHVGICYANKCNTLLGKWQMANKISIYRNALGTFALIRLRFRNNFTFR